ncbi:MAG: T9SS type A sorting domain-containing protein [Bacteroidales bacterium]|jgi:hypothetical protein|nr:T9SS type A sorting domain-containing protein [Bacteroidales bacterium]
MKRKLLFLVAMMAVMSHSLFAQVPPNWEAPGNMQSNMTVVAQLELNPLGDPDVYSSNPNDVVAAFVNGEVRGVAHPDANGLVFMTIVSDNLVAEEITMKAYVYTSGLIGGHLTNIDIYNAVPELILSIPFVNQDYLGTPADPYTLKCVPLTWTITPSVGTGNGTFNPAGVQTVDNGDDQSFIITPEVGYHFTSIMVNNLSDANPAYDVYDENLLVGGVFTYAFTNVTNDWSIQANFEINNYTLEFYAGPYGTLSGPNPANLALTLTSQPSLIYNLDHGTALGIITAVPNDNCSFLSWSDAAVNPRTATSATDDVSATASFELTGWTPANNYLYTMSLIGQIIIDGVPSTDPSDMLGAFFFDGANDVCRGTATPGPDGLVFLSIGSDAFSGEPIFLKIRDGATGDICEAAFRFEFLSNDQLGTITVPKVIECQISLQKTIPAGYTWFSANIETNSEDNPWNPNNYFDGAWFKDDFKTPEGGNPVLDDRIIGQTDFAVYATIAADDQWVGSLTAMSAKKMYRLFMTGGTTRYLKLIGSAVANTQITVNPGYTWLGYLPREDLSIGTALADFTGLVVGDRIISQNKFAIYNGTGWQGSLLTMSPGNGYVVQMVNGGILNYPDYVYAKSAVFTYENVVSPAGFEAPANMKNTMTLIGQLDKASFSDKDVVYAFINGECRGMAPVSTDGNIYLSIGENSDEAQEVSFKVWVDAKGELANIDQTVIFEPLKAVGDLDHPFTFKMSEAGTTDSWMVGKAYPNPFNEQTIIPLWLKESAQVTVNVYNNVGQLVKTVAQAAAKSGVSNIILQKENLDKGVYYYTISINSSSANVLETGKLIIQ